MECAAPVSLHLQISAGRFAYPLDHEHRRHPRHGVGTQHAGVHQPARLHTNLCALLHSQYAPTTLIPPPPPPLPPSTD